jgi:hypothetical protein
LFCIQKKSTINRQIKLKPKNTNIFKFFMLFKIS